VTGTAKTEKFRDRNGSDLIDSDRIGQS